MSESTPKGAYMLTMVKGTALPRWQRYFDDAFSMMIDGLLTPHKHSKVMRRLKTLIEKDGLNVHELKEVTADAATPSPSAEGEGRGEGAGLKPGDFVIWKVRKVEHGGILESFNPEWCYVKTPDDLHVIPTSLLKCVNSNPIVLGTKAKP